MQVTYYPKKDFPPRAGSLVLGGITFAPNLLTEIAGEKTPEIQGDPGYQRRIELGAIVEQTENTAPTDYANLEDLSVFTIEDKGADLGAESIVEQTEDAALLTRWLEAESRTTLKAIIETRLEELADG